jgi:hypothetical protein
MASTAQTRIGGKYLIWGRNLPRLRRIPIQTPPPHVPRSLENEFLLARFGECFICSYLRMICICIGYPVASISRLTRSSACSQVARRTDTPPSSSANWGQPSSSSSHPCGCGSCLIATASTHIRIGDRPLTLGYLQHNQVAEAEITLLEWCPPAAVRLGLEAGRAFARALELHGLMIPIREYETVPPRTPSIAAPSGSALLH